MEKETVVSELLTLRGGLSLISKYTDEIKAEEEKRKIITEEKDERIKTKEEILDDKEHDIALARENIEKSKAEVLAARTALDGLNTHEYSDRASNEERARRTIEISRPSADDIYFDPADIDFDLDIDPYILPDFYDDFGEKVKKWIPVAGACYFLFFIFASIAYSIESIFWHIVSILAAAPATIPLVLTVTLPIIRLLIFLINPFVNYIICPLVKLLAVIFHLIIKAFYILTILPIRKLIYKKQYNELLKREIESGPRRMENIKNKYETQLESSRQKLQDAEDYLKEQVEYYENYEFELEEDIKMAKKSLADINNQLDILINKSKTLVAVMDENYSSILSRSDWGSIDFILHYLLTGRADTLKEALQQLDRQTQTDQIVGAIQSAEAAISSHIMSAYSNLGHVISQSFSRIDDRLKYVAVNMNSVGEHISEKIDMQIRAQEMNAALLEKSNTTNETLLHDLRYNQSHWIK